jgi:hypothetical protein
LLGELTAKMRLSTTLSFIQIDLISYEQLTIGVRDGGEEKKQSQNMETF